MTYHEITLEVIDRISKRLAESTIIFPDIENYAIPNLNACF
jgi:hypothetical protein